MPNAWKRYAVGGMQAEQEQQAQLETNSISQRGRWWRRCRELSGPFGPNHWEEEAQNWAAAQWGVCHQFQKVVRVPSEWTGFWVSVLVVSSTGIHGISLQHQTLSYNSGEEMGLTWVVSLFLSLALTIRMLDIWVQRHFKVRLHRYSAAASVIVERKRDQGILSCWVCCSHTAEAVFGWVSVMGQLTASSLFTRNVAAGFPWMAPAIALEFWCSPWLPLGIVWGAELYGSFYLPLLGQHLPRTGTFVCLQLHLQILY